MSSDLKQVCDRLRHIGRRKPTVETRREVEAALQSKWEGVQVVAARSLAAWGDERSKQLIKDKLAVFVSKKYGWAATGALARTLAPMLTGKDTEWAIHLLLRRSRRATAHSLWPLLAALPFEDVTAKLEYELNRIDTPVRNEAEGILFRLCVTRRDKASRP